MPEDQIIIYQIENGKTAIDVKIDNDTVWLTLNQISNLFYKNKSTISRHLNNIYKEEELNQRQLLQKKQQFK
jgi:hypothetical protein